MKPGVIDYWQEIQSIYGMSKKSFGKKIYFVKDK